MKFQAVLLIVFVASAYQAIVLGGETPTAKDATTDNASIVVPTTTSAPDANTTTTIAPNSTTTIAPNSTTTEAPTTTTTHAPNTTTLAPNTTTVAPKTTTVTPAPNTTTVAPVTTTTEKPAPAPPCRRFDGPSFIGGIVLTVGLIAIGFVAHKIYKSKFERNYHTL